MSLSVGSDGPHKRESALSPIVRGILIVLLVALLVVSVVIGLANFLESIPGSGRPREKPEGRVIVLTEPMIVTAVQESDDRLLVLPTVMRFHLGIGDKLKITDPPNRVVAAPLGRIFIYSVGWLDNGTKVYIPYHALQRELRKRKYI